MHALKVAFAFITLIALACWPTMESFASPAAAKTIVVTTNRDVVSSPFNPSGLCDTGTVKDLPGADGQVSLREAIIAANNTNGKKVITFAP